MGLSRDAPDSDQLRRKKLTGPGCLALGQPQHSAVVVRARTPAGKQHDRDTHSDQRFHGVVLANAIAVVAGEEPYFISWLPVLSDLSILSLVSFYRSLITG
ncbi:hypothetical protein B296_00017520 [Ensete ventricosum]|uniref:Uncharacterized protein n=1 Tax=Ensete ventricosum TaxID=4639 RepID=A0A426Y7H6_ENSVE|nr:hypothetical protein B296_00017520 [Ensete ventricosum]